MRADAPYSTVDGAEMTTLEKNELSKSNGEILSKQAMKRRLFESLREQGYAVNEETLFPLTADTTRIECLLGNIDAEKPSKTLSFIHIRTSNSYMAKAGSASRPILHLDKDSPIPSTYYGLGGRGQTVMRVL